MWKVYLFQYLLIILLQHIVSGCSTLSENQVNKKKYAIDDVLLPLFENSRLSIICYLNSYEKSIENYVTFYHYTQKNKDIPEEIKINYSSNMSKWLFGAPVRIIIHGFVDSNYLLSPPRLRKAYLQYKNYNIIVVDWSKISQSFCYKLCISKIDTIGMYTAKLIRYLLKGPARVKLSDIQLIGHSLGAHISGAVGKHMGMEKIPIIYGLDPAGPLFRNVSPNSRLDPSDAEYVEAIHTDAKDGYGIGMPVGHVDFYVNGGYNQPECIDHSYREELPIIDEILPGFVSPLLNLCSHLQVYEIFARSLEIEFENTDLTMMVRKGLWGSKCECVEDAFERRCLRNSKAVWRKIGEPPDKKSYGIYQIITND